MISVLDYGSGNVNSVIRMVEKAGGKAIRAVTKEDLLKAEKLIIPGVGAFDYCMGELIDRNMVEILNTVALEKKVPVLGVCVGMQLMCRSSEEGILPGLGWFDAAVKRFPDKKNTGLNVPHMGWNEVKKIRETELFSFTDKHRYYFVHSYWVDCCCSEDIVLLASYGHDFVAAFQKNNISGVQFHPEKSHRFGMEIIRNFWRMNA